MTITEQSLEILRECQEAGSSVMFSGDGVDIVFQTQILSIGKDYVSILNKVPPEYIRSMIKSRQFSLQSKMMRFQSQTISTDGVNILFPLDRLKEIEETRQAERFPFEADERVICELINPYDKETVLSKAVLDMSATGLSIRSPKASSLFRPGTLFNDVKVIIDGEPYTKTAASVVYTRKLMDLNGILRVQVGLKFEPIRNV